ncbi:hypothetical protein ACGFWI_01530 [Streptomyces sp. NPDC048434]|uniref:hypothetical protein n=1 Tax=Streptomyces sp. NPDC048434 TaxID=3365549 RepID=UPI00371A8BEF
MVNAPGRGSRWLRQQPGRPDDSIVTPGRHALPTNLLDDLRSALGEWWDGQLITPELLTPT